MNKVFLTVHNKHASRSKKIGGNEQLGKAEIRKKGFLAAESKSNY